MSGFERLLLELVRRTIERPRKADRYVDGHRLAAALRANPDVVLPPSVHAYLCDFLEGKIKKPRGRKKTPYSTMLRDQLLIFHHERYAKWLKKRKRTVGLGGCKGLRKADWWRGPPNERAARMAVRNIRQLRALRLPLCDWRHVLNLVSSSKNPRK